MVAQGLLKPTKINGSKHDQNIWFGLKQIENMHGHWFISVGQREHAFLSSTLHFIQTTWFLYFFANICRVPLWVQL